MPLYTIEIFANNRAQEMATRQAIAGVLQQNLQDFKIDVSKRNTGTVRLVADLNDNQRKNIIRLNGVQTVRPVR